MKPWLLRLLLVVGVVLTSGIALFLTISYVAIPLFTWLSPTLNPTLYDLGFYGGSPSQSYVSNDLTSPRLSTVKSDSACDPGYVFLNYNGGSMAAPGPAILTANNELVWKAENYHVTTNLKVQTYKKRQYLTFWTGEKGGTMGRGVYHMVSPHVSNEHDRELEGLSRAIS